jgi:pyruvate,water dikinase
LPELSGLATEIGGLTSHGVVIAREYGLPCIVRVEGASKLFKSGDIVLID